MLIGINLLYLIPDKVGGTETYARELITGMVKHLSKQDKLIIFCGKEVGETFSQAKQVKIVVLPLYSQNRVSRIIQEQTLLPYLCFVKKINILLSLGYSAPFIHHCPSIVTIHDLNWYYHPEDFNIINRIFWKYLTLLSAKCSDHIITDSSASKGSILTVLKVAPIKVTSILHGTPATLDVKPYKSKRPYIFTVLANYPHKNLKTLLQAFELVTKKYPNLDLYICGLGKQLASSSNINYLGYVTRERLASLYKGAEVFVFPSAYEGFGYPVLEAMSYGCPVVSSNAYSLSEVVGDGGILVEPLDIQGYAHAITSLLSSSKMRNQLIVLGAKRVKDLNWSKTVKYTIELIENYTKG